MPKAPPEPKTWRGLKRDLSACTHCADEGIIPAAGPVFQLPATARIGVFSQAPGNLAHEAGKPFLDPSGVRLRDWMGVTDTEFYDSGRLAITPMAFCFPGYDGKSKSGKGGDLPPPRVCAERWRGRVMDLVWEQLEVVLLIGRYAIEWHLPEAKGRPLTDLVADWPSRFATYEEGGKLILPLPHPSWRNNAWLKKNPWFGEEVVPRLRMAVREAMGA